MTHPDQQTILPVPGDPIHPTFAPKVCRIPIGNAFFLVEEGELHVVFLCDVPLYHFRRADAPACYLAAVDLVRHHGVKVIHVAAAFRMHRATLHKMIRRFECQGVRGLFPGKGRRMPTKIKDVVERRLLELSQQGAPAREIARRLGLSVSGVKSALSRLGSEKPDGVQVKLPFDAEVNAKEQQSAAVLVGTSIVDVAPEASVPCTAPSVSSMTVSPSSTAEEGGSPEESSPAAEAKESASAVRQEPSHTEQQEEIAAPATAVSAGCTSVDLDPLNRVGDRLMARLGLLNDATPLFASSPAVPHAGVLLAIPALVDSGIFDIARKVYGSLGPAFYGLRTTVLAFLVLALLRIKRPENIKEECPQSLGRVLGLDRSPEVRSLRRKLRDLAARAQSLTFLKELAQVRAKRQTESLAYLYVDGHVRPYHGGAAIPKGYSTQRRLAVPATTDYWVNDRDGEPVLVVTAEANDGLVTMLPNVLKEVRPLLGERRATAVFDRGGWSPRLFASLIQSGFDVLTYRKGKADHVCEGAFVEHVAVIDGRNVKYLLAEQPIRLLNGRLEMRQVTWLGEHGHQTTIITNRTDLPTIQVAYRMFERWRQENFFKYMKEEFALDALPEYGAELADPDRMVPNPRRKEVDKELQTARAHQANLEREYGQAAYENREDRRPTMRGFKIANGRDLGKPLRDARTKVEELEAKRKAIPERIPVRETTRGALPVQLKTESKRFTDTLKLVAYQAETALVRLVRPFYHRCDEEGRTLIAATMRSAAGLTVTDEELTVTLAPLSSPHRSRAIHELCRELNRLDVTYPGTTLKLRYSISDAKCSHDAEGVCQEF